MTIFDCPVRRAFFFLWVAVALMAACSGADKPIPAAPPPTRLLPTAPPTRTPTQSPTSQPSTLTPTATPSPTLTLTRAPDQICADFRLLAGPRSGATIAFDGRVAYSWQNVPPDFVIRVAFLHREKQEGILVEWPPLPGVNMPFEMLYLADTGVYDWRLTLYSEDTGDVCAVRDWFVRAEPNPAATPTRYP